MNRIRNLFGNLNTFVRGTFNYVIGNNNGQETQPVDQEETRENDNDVVEAVARPKWNSKGKEKKTRGKKKSAKRNNTPTKRHPRQKQITVKIPKGREPFNLEGIFKVPVKSHAPINCSDGFEKQSDELIISEKTVPLENAIKYGSKAEAIDARDKLANRLPKQENILPFISNQTKNVAGDRGVLGKPVESNALLINEENSSSIDSKKDDIKKPSTKQKHSNEGTKTTGEENCQRDGLKLPDILSCQGSLVSQPISCSVRNPTMAMALPKQLRSRIPSLLTQVQKRAFLSTLETIQENRDEKHFNSQSLTEGEDKKLGKIAAENHLNSEQEVRTFFKGERENVRRGSTPALNSQASQLLNKVSDMNTKVDAKALGSVETTQGKEAQEKHTNANSKKEKKKKKKKKKKKTKAKEAQEPKDNEVAESFQPCTQGNLDPISVHGKSPLERLREVESKLLAQKQVQFGKVFCRNNKVAPLSTELAGLKKPEIRNDIDSSLQSSKVKPLLQPLRTEKPHTDIAKVFPSLPSVKVPAVLPNSSTLPRIVPRCQSPKIFNTVTDQETRDHRCAGFDLRLFEYEPSDEEEQLEKENMYRGRTAEKQRMESHISPALVYEPSDDEEEKDKLKQLPKPKRKFSVQDRLRMGKKMMSFDKECRGDKSRASNADEYCRPTENVARADTLNVALDVVPRHMGKTSMINNNCSLNCTEIAHATKQQEQRRVLPSLEPRGRSFMARTDTQLPQDHCDLKVWDLFDFEDASEWQL